MKEECLICKQPLEYLEEGILMECAICHKKENSKTRCVNGHYVCSECHTKGMGIIIGLCLNEHSKNPIEIINKMMSQPFCHMHGPEHHVMVGAALLTAYHNAGGELELEKALTEVYRRGKEVPAVPVDSGALVVLESVPECTCRLLQNQHLWKQKPGVCVTR